MVDQRDRLGDKLHQLEMAREDQWAAARDRELLEKLRRRDAAVEMRCPKCQKVLASRTRSGITMLECAGNHGAWLDAGALKTLLAKAG